MGTMRILISTLMLVFTFTSIGFGKSDQVKENQLTQEGRNYNFLFSEHKGNRIGIVNKKGEIVWEYKCAHPQDVCMDKNGGILIATSRAAIYINQEKKILWKFEIKAPNEIPYCQFLKNGNLTIGIEGENVIHEISKKGVIINSTHVPTSSEKIHGTFRFLRRTEQDTYVIPLLNDEKFVEIDLKGELVRTFPFEPVCAVSALRLKNGNTILGCGTDGIIYELDKNNKIVWLMNREAHGDLQIKCITGLSILNDHTLVACNWGIRKESSRELPHIWAVNKDKKIVWRVWGDAIGSIAQIQLLDDNFMPLK